MADSEVRQRKGKEAGDKPSSKTASKTVKEQDEASSKLDLFRILTFLFLVSCGLSYVITGGDSWFWGSKNKPNYLRVDWWKARLVSFCAPPLSDYIVQKKKRLTDVFRHRLST
jgi:hypothetical protein